MGKPNKILLMTVFGFASISLDSDGLATQPKNTLAEEKICKNIGFRPKTEAFGSCVLELVDRNIPKTSAPASSNAKPTRDLLAEDGQYQRQANARRLVAAALGEKTDAGSAQASSKRPPAAVKSAARDETSIIPLSPNEQTCVSYSFKRGTQAFGQCLMQLDQIQQQAMIAERQHQFQLAQYQQQVEAYNAQQAAIKREKNRREGEALMRMSQGILNSRSPSLLGNIADGFASANGSAMPQPVAPQPPIMQNYTIRGPNGNQIYCSYNTAARYMNCR